MLRSLAFAGLQRVGKVVASVLNRMLEAAQPGMTTRELDTLGERWLAEHGARSAPRLTYGFPGSTCISIEKKRLMGFRAIASFNLARPSS